MPNTLHYQCHRSTYILHRHHHLTSSTTPLPSIHHCNCWHLNHCLCHWTPFSITITIGWFCHLYIINLFIYIIIIFYYYFVQLKIHERITYGLVFSSIENRFNLNLTQYTPILLSYIWYKNSFLIYIIH